MSKQRKKKETDHNGVLLINQRNMSDCAIAALAMLYEITYKACRALVLQDYTGRYSGLSYDQAQLLGKRLGEPLKVQYVTPKNRKAVIKSLSERRCVCIVRAHSSEDAAEYHAVYWTGRFLYDPSHTQKYGRSGEAALATLTEVWYINEE